MTEALRVVLVEDSLLLREGLVRLFDEAGYVTAGAFGDAGDIVARVREAAADVVVIDVRLPPTYRDEGIRAALEIRRALPDVGVLVLSQYVELIAEGRSNANIAERLVIGVGAVDKNVSAIFAKLGLAESASDNRRVLAVLAYLQRS